MNNLIVLWIIPFPVLKTQTNMHVLRDLLQALKAGLAAGEYHHVGCTSLWNKHIHTVERLQNMLNSLQIKEVCFRFNL